MMDGRKHPTFLFHQQLTIQIKPHQVLNVLKFKLEYSAKASKQTGWHLKVQMNNPDNEWWPSVDENPHVSFLLDMDLLWNYFPAIERSWCIYFRVVLWNLWLCKEGQSLLIKTVKINHMTLLPDSHLQYIRFMNQVFLPEALKLYI